MWPILLLFVIDNNAGLRGIAVDLLLASGGEDLGFDWTEILCCCCVVVTDLLVRDREEITDGLGPMSGSLVVSASFGDGGLWMLSGTECFLV